jgi:hypothetical protein
VFGGLLGKVLLVFLRVGAGELGKGPWGRGRKWWVGVAMSALRVLG